MRGTYDGFGMFNKIISKTHLKPLKSIDAQKQVSNENACKTHLGKDAILKGCRQLYTTNSLI